MNGLLWVLQVLLGFFFVVIGVLHFVLLPGLPAPMAWMYDLSPGLHYFSGSAEIAAGLGLVLPGLTGIQTRLTPLAAVGLVFLMVGAIVWHCTRSEFTNVARNILLMGLSGFIAYGRWKLSPLPDKGSLSAGAAT